jgi:tetratricopeptide (TPR) repeat protein
VFFHTSGEFERGIALLQEALAIHQQRQDAWHMAICYMFLGNAKLIQNEYGESVAYFAQGFQLVRALGDRFAQASALGFLAAATLGYGQPTEARQIAEEALRFAQQTGDRWITAQALHVLGLVGHGEQNYQAARRLLEESAAICEQLEEAWSLSRVTFNLGKTLLAASEGQAAQQMFRRSLQVAYAAQLLPDVLNVLITLVGEATSTTPTRDSYRWALLVAQHPASTTKARSQAEGLCRALQPSLSPPILQSPGDPLQASTLDEMVVAFLGPITGSDLSQPLN